MCDRVARPPSFLLLLLPPSSSSCLIYQGASASLHVFRPLPLTLILCLLLAFFRRSSRGLVLRRGSDRQLPFNISSGNKYVNHYVLLPCVCGSVHAVETLKVQNFFDCTIICVVLFLCISGTHAPLPSHSSRVALFSRNADLDARAFQSNNEHEFIPHMLFFFAST